MIVPEGLQTAIFFFICSAPLERLATLRRYNFLPLFSVLCDFESSLYVYRSAMSPYNDSFVGWTQFRSTFLTILSSSMRSTCPSQLRWRSVIFIRIFSVGVRASSGIQRPVIFEIIFDTVLFSLRCTWAVIFQDSLHPYSSVDITDAFNSRIRGLLGSLGEVRMRFRFVYRDQAISTRWFTGTNRSPSPDCNSPEYLKCNTFFSSSPPCLTFLSSSCAAWAFVCLTIKTAIYSKE